MLITKRLNRVEEDFGRLEKIIFLININTQYLVDCFDISACNF